MLARQVLQDLTFGQRVAEEEGEALASYFVETDHWRRLYSGDVDVIYGPKGAGKSALYSLLLRREKDLLDRRIILVPAENPRGAPAFRDLVADPPMSEREFVALWKLYFATLLSDAFDTLRLGGTAAVELRDALAQEGLVRNKRSLQATLQGAYAYVRRFFRPTAVETGLQLDPISQMPSAITGKIVFGEPALDEAKRGFRSVDALLQLCSDVLVESDFTVWLLLDRLDVAFAESPLLEQNALRALFKVYLDLLTHERIRLKIFLRTDIWRRISEGGFREASHITRHMTIDWNRTSLLNLVIRRTTQNVRVMQFYNTTPEDVLETSATQETFLYRFCPDQVDVGPNKPSTFDWLLSRTRDASQSNAPRELIHMLNSLRNQQVRRLEVGEPEPDGERLFARPVFKDALPEVSHVRLEQTLYAEYPQLRALVEKLRGQKASQTTRSLAVLWGVTEDEARQAAKELIEIGFFEQRGPREEPDFWVPFLYRDALDLVQGSAD
jgi:hypothetical protein